jgi:hypothetical protein
MMRSAAVVLSLAVGAAGCASLGLNPAQERAYGAFKDCQGVAPTAQLGELLEDGRFSFTARPGDYQRMIQCLKEKHGYQFQ